MNHILVADLTRIWEAQRMGIRTIEHLLMFGAALVIVIPIGIGLGIVLYRRPGMSPYLFQVLNTVETIPEIPLLVLLIPLVGIGAPAVIVACVLYSLLPVTRNTFSGLSSVRGEYIEAATALGLKEQELLRKVRFPLSLPLIAGGIRIAVIFCMGIVTLGGLIGAGGLGAPLQTGISFRNTTLILLCTAWIAFLALSMDSIAGFIERRVRARYGEIS